MSNLRTGTYGEYYGSYWGESAPLTATQQDKNGLYIYSALIDAGWSAEAISGMLGNMVYESSLNPGRWEGDSVGSGPGYSLVQWTPYTNYTDWCAQQGLSDPSEMDNALARILYELDNGLQYFPTDNYPLTFREFTKSTGSPYDLACAFAWNYERSAVVLWGANSKAEADTLTEAEKEANRERLRLQRGASAEAWYTYLTGQTPTPPDPGGGGGTTTKRKSGFNFLLFGRRNRRFTL